MRLQRALEMGLRPGGNLPKALRRVSDFDFGAVEAGLLEEALQSLTGTFDKGIGLPEDQQPVDDLFLILRTFTFAGYGPGYERILQAARMPLSPESYLWSMLFDSVAHGEPTQARKLILSLKPALPSGFLGIAYLDAANCCARAGIINSSEHPFDSAAGHSRLEQCLTSRVPGEFSFACSAAGALPYVSRPQQDRLIGIAMEHPDQSVAVEAAFAAASQGNRRGLEFLVQMCLIPGRNRSAAERLRDLGHVRLIPEETLQADFQASVEMCEWLSHPGEFGQPPDHIELFDTRVMHWPPTGDERRVWLFRYRYYGEIDTGGIGMVGSVTFALTDIESAGRTAEEIYELHCRWELEHAKP